MLFFEFSFSRSTVTLHHCLWTCVTQESIGRASRSRSRHDRRDYGLMLIVAIAAFLLGIAVGMYAFDA